MSKALAVLVAVMACMAPAYASAQSVDRGAHGVVSDPVTPIAGGTPAAVVAPRASADPTLTPQQAAVRTATKRAAPVRWPLVASAIFGSIAAFLAAVWLLSRGIRQLFPPRQYA